MTKFVSFYSPTPYNYYRKKYKEIFNPLHHFTDKEVELGENSMYHAKGIKDLLKTIPLNEEFFSNLGPFQLNFIEMCFKKSLDEQIGMMSEIEFGNYQIFMKYKTEYEEEFYPELKTNKKAS